MPQYSYRPELKKPGPIGSIDFGNPALAPMIRMVVQNLRQTARAWAPPEGLKIRTLEIPSWDGAAVACFVVEPDTNEPLPGMLYCHGGGFFLPLQVSALELAAVYAQKLGARMFLPDYRILPEYPNPYPFRDCLSAWTEMQARADAFRLDGRILLYGESAGGALAAGLAQLLRDQGGEQPLGQALIYPVLDDETECYPSMALCDGAVWTRQSNDYMWSAYLKNGFQGFEPYVIPMKNEDLAGLPPAYIEPQEIDILRDQALAYGEKLRSAGVPVEQDIVNGSYHGFDADVGNPFVQNILERRIHAMAGMLASHQNEV